MSGRALVLRDGSGREYRAVLAPDGAVAIGAATLQVAPAADGSLQVTGVRQARVWTAAVGSTHWVFVEGRVFTFEADRQARRRVRSAGHHGPLTAPMPATVRAIHVAPGDRIQRGDLVLVLEAMKMELPVRAPADGRVRAVNCREGDLVQPGQDLVELEAVGT